MIYIYIYIDIGILKKRKKNFLFLQVEIFCAMINYKCIKNVLHNHITSSLRWRVSKLNRNEAFYFWRYDVSVAHRGASQ